MYLYYINAVEWDACQQISLGRCFLQPRSDVPASWQSLAIGHPAGPTCVPAAPYRPAPEPPPYINIF